LIDCFPHQPLEKERKRKSIFCILGPVHATPEELENNVITLKTRQMFSVHTTLEKFKNATITGHLGFWFEDDWVREIT